jgi:hypothetical protein
MKHRGKGLHSMRKRRLTAPGFPIVPPRTAVFLVFLLLAATVVPGASGQNDNDNATRVAQQQQTRFVYFGLAAGATYEVRTNEATFEEIASPDGAVGFTDAASTGEQITVTQTGVAQVCPADPAGFGVTDNGSSCGRFSWNTPDAADYVSSYRLYWGFSAGAYTDSTDFDVLRVVEQGGTSYFTLCGFPEGKYYFTLRAYNQFACWSGLGGEAVVTIAGGSTQPPLPPTDVAAVESQSGCATVSWTASGSPGVTGYTVYWGVTASVYTDSSQVSGATETEICGFSPRRWYFAVKTKSGALESVYSQEVTLDITGPDATPPAFSEIEPADGATSVVRNTRVFFVVADAGAGVDRSTIVVTINGASADVSTLGSSAQYMAVASLTDPLPANTSVTVVATASDLADSPNEGSITWSFETGTDVAVDTEPPVFSGLTPANGASNVPADKPVRVTIGDDQLGVDLSSIRFYINGTEVAYSLEGDIRSATLVYSEPLPQGATVNVRVEACDLADPANCATLDDYSFAVGGASYASLPDGAIVPDGFWASEPERPLEVRNLPRDWTVRIFDTSGTPVRRYRNDTGEGTNWEWDFNNDHGRRVARAIYLVRVTDGSGAIQQSGRFLVQIDP